MKCDSITGVMLSLATAVMPAVAYAAPTPEELAKMAQNPLAKLVSVPFQNNTNFNVGPQSGTQNILNIQPVVTQPGFVPDQGSTTGLGAIQTLDVTYPTAFLDGDDKPLDATHRYVLHFDKGQLPPTNVTW